MSDIPRSPILPMDTTAEADAVQIEAYRRLSGAERAATTFRLTDLVRAAAMAGIRKRHPEYDEARVRMAWQRLVLGDHLVRQVYPDRELVDP